MRLVGKTFLSWLGSRSRMVPTGASKRSMLQAGPVPCLPFLLSLLPWVAFPTLPCSHVSQRDVLPKVFPQLPPVTLRLLPTGLHFGPNYPKSNEGSFFSGPVCWYLALSAEAHTRTCIWTHTQAHTCMHTPAHTCTCTHTSTQCMHAHARIRMYTNTQAHHMHAHAPTHTCTHMHAHTLILEPAAVVEFGVWVFRPEHLLPLPCPRPMGTGCISSCRLCTRNWHHLARGQKAW